MEGSNLTQAEEDVFAPLPMMELTNTSHSSSYHHYYISEYDFDEWSLMKLAADWTMFTLSLSSCIYQFLILNRCRPLTSWTEIYLLHYSMFNIVAHSSVILFKISHPILLHFPQIFEFYCLAFMTQETAAIGVFAIVVGLSLDWLNTIRRGKLIFFGNHIGKFHKVFISLVYLLVASNCGVVTYRCLGEWFLISNVTIIATYYLSVSIVALVNLYTIINKPSEDEKKKEYGLQVANYVLGSSFGLISYLYFFMYFYSNLSKTSFMILPVLFTILKCFAQSAPIMVLIVSLNANERLMKNSSPLLRVFGSKKRVKFNLLDNMEQNGV